MTATKFAQVPRDFMEQAVYLGVDQSLRKTGLAFENEASQVISCVLSPPDGMKDVHRLNWYRENFRYILGLPKLRTAAIEGYSFGSKFTREALGELGGVLRLAAYDAKVPTVIASPNGVKKFLTGLGTGKKQNMTKEVLKVYGLDVDDDNEADAIVLSQIARAADTREISTQYRREVLDSLTVLIPRAAPPPRVRTRTIPN